MPAQHPGQNLRSNCVSSANQIRTKPYEPERCSSDKDGPAAVSGKICFATNTASDNKLARHYQLPCKLRIGGAQRNGDGGCLIPSMRKPNTQHDMQLH